VHIILASQRPAARHNPRTLPGRCSCCASDRFPLFAFARASPSRLFRCHVRLQRPEQAALGAIVSQYPSLKDALDEQLRQAIVSSRENSGAGFFTRIEMRGSAPTVESDYVIGNVDADGLQYGMGFILFMEEGRVSCLEGFSYQGDTTALDFGRIGFTIKPSFSGS
jgi:hypothetical protein